MRMGPLVPAPNTPAERLARQVQSYIFMPTFYHLWGLMGAVAANLIEGEPVWLTLIGPPSCGKTEMLNSLLEVPGIVESGDISGEAAFLSGTARKDRSQDATGGLLRQIGDHGGLLVNDLTSLISKNQEKLSTILGVFRECYGGRWTRHIGNEGGRMMHWTGKLGVFAGVTGRIDSHHTMTAELGERWIQLRYECDAAYRTQALNVALSGQRPDDWQHRMRAAVREMFEEVNARFGSLLPAREFTVSERVRLEHFAELAVRCRSGVSRDSYTRQITAAEQEVPIRIGRTLSQMLLGLDLIGVPEADRWVLLRKIALDSMPQLRKDTIALVSSARSITISEITAGTSYGESTIRRTVEDLEAHGVLRRVNSRICFTDWMKDAYLKFGSSYA